MKAPLSLWVALALLALPTAAMADKQEPGQAAPRAGVTVEVSPVLGTSAPAAGWNEIVVRLQNDTGSAARGRVELASSGYLDRDAFRATAPYHVAPGATA